MNFKTISIPYYKNLTAIYQNFTEFDSFALLQSSDVHYGRFDILSGCPYDEFKLERGQPVPLNIFEQLQDFIPSATSDIPLPFLGGGIGYISYDVGAKLKGFDKCLPDFLNETPLIDIKLYDWAIISDHKLCQATLVYANHCSNTESLIQDILHCWHQTEKTDTYFKLTKDVCSLVDKAQYQNAFISIYDDLVRGRAYQVNYTLPFLAEFEGDPWCLYKKLTSLNPVPFGGFLRFDDLDVLSFSPERFIRIVGSDLLTSPIKGTAPRSNDPEIDHSLQKRLIASEKDKAENVMIVDLMRNDLSKISARGSVKVDTLFECQSFQSVHHLVSHITTTIKSDKNLGDILNACFPGGSITGAPKLEAMKIISELENYGRGVYCGNMGYFSYHGNVDTNIAIRTMMAKDNKLYLQAGGGITISSNCLEEFNECYTKLKAIVENINR